MSESSEKLNDRMQVEVVRLRLDGADFTVNTLSDGRTARGLSVVCPFPALEVDLPVRFGYLGESELRKGTVHRIGVESDPGSGLPRLRLAIRAETTRATILEPPGEQLVAKSAERTDRIANAGRADTDMDFGLVDGMGTGAHQPVSTAQIVSTVPCTGPLSATPSLPDLPRPLTVPDEPPWAGSPEVPLPAELIARRQGQARRRVATVVSWVAILLVACGGVAVLSRAGFMDPRQLRSFISGLSLDDTAAARRLGEPVAEVAVAPAPPAVVPSPLQPAGPPEPIAVAPAEIPPEQPVAAAASDGPVALEAPVASEPAPGSTPATVPVAEDVTVLLPTKWPVEHAATYRVRDPNGVVVDLPGGEVLREGWLTLADKPSMVRSIKVMQRPEGARFIVYINGELPRFLTTPRNGGMGLRLMREAAEPVGRVERIASLP